MNRDIHVRIREKLRVKFPRLTRLLILCKTKRQLNRCKRRMMNVLQERQLRLSKRKTRIGAIESGFHFLGIQYPPTRMVDNTSIAPVDDGAIVDPKPPRGGILYCKINHTAFYALFRTPEHCVKHANKLDGWSPMVFLAQRSNNILFNGYAGGQTRQALGNIKN